MSILHTSVAALYYLRHTPPSLVQSMQAQTKGSFTKVTILLAQRYQFGNSHIQKIGVVKYVYEQLIEEHEIG